jgi:hypothetical protein
LTTAVFAGGQGAFSYQVLATLGEPTPSGVGVRINDFEPGGINNSGDVLFGNDLGKTADPSTFFGEGIFLRRKGQESVLANATAPAPGGGTFAFLFLGPSALNDPGDAAFAFTLSTTGSPFDIATPVGVNSGVYRYSHNSGKVTALVVPGVTPAPGDGTFSGVFFGPSINNGGTIIFPGIVPTDKGIHLPTEPYVGLGMGLYRADKAGGLSRVVVPGDPAPGGGTFDFADSPWVNDGGDVAFLGHIAGEEVNAPPQQPPQAQIINALGSAYVKDAATGRILSVAHAGVPIPGVGTFRQVISPIINNQGQIAFLGDLTPPPNANLVIGVFLWSKGEIIPVARPGDAMPGGGLLVTASNIGGNQIHVNNRGDVVFNAVLNTDVNGDGIPDTGLYQRSNGELRLVARTGTVVSGQATISNLVMGTIVVPPPPGFVPNSGAVSNDRGQVLFGATLSDGRGVLLLATP